MRVAKSEVLRQVALGITGLLSRLPGHSIAEVKQHLLNLTAFGDGSEQEKGEVAGEVAFAVFGAIVALRAVGVPMGAPELARVMLDELAKEEARLDKLSLVSRMMFGGMLGAPDDTGR